MDIIREEIDFLNYHTNLYEKGTPIISDAEWDNHYFNLVNLEKESGIYYADSPTQKINYEVVTNLKKVTHNHPMLSLDKTKDWNEFLQYFSSIDVSKDVVGMLKLDGLTCSLRYVNGRLVSAETRGNGEIGEDILHNALVVQNIPNKINYFDELIVDGEIICDLKTFEEFKNDYANARNFAAGSIRLQNSYECASRKLKFILWNVIKGPHKTIIDNFVAMEKFGFTITPWTSSFDLDAKNYLIEEAKREYYPIDGLVGRFNNQEFGDSLGATGHHSRAAYAFKFYDEEYETTLLNIEWTMGRTGVLTPVAIFEPVDTGDSIIERASLHNISIMKEILGIAYQGQRIQVCKMNDIIPQILSGGCEISQADIAQKFIIPTKCPICGEELTIECEVNTEILKCNNPECLGKLLNRLVHFCGKKGLDIKGLSKATLEKLIEWEWVTQPADLYKLYNYRNEWIKKAGFGEKSVDNILQAIENSRNPKLESFISALGIPLIGINISKDLIKYVTSYEDFRNKAKSRWDFTVINGIAYEKASAIWNFNFDEADAINEYILGYQVPKEENNNTTLKNLNVVITGTLTRFKNRNELVSLIEQYGGKVTSSVSKNTTCLINNNKNSTSSKNLTAKKLEIPIISEEEFFENYLTI